MSFFVSRNAISVLSQRRISAKNGDKWAHESGTDCRTDFWHHKKTNSKSGIVSLVNRETICSTFIHNLQRIWSILTRQKSLTFFFRETEKLHFRLDFKRQISSCNVTSNDETLILSEVMSKFQRYVTLLKLFYAFKKVCQTFKGPLKSKIVKGMSHFKGHVTLLRVYHTFKGTSYL